MLSLTLNGALSTYKIFIMILRDFYNDIKLKPIPVKCECGSMWVFILYNVSDFFTIIITIFVIDLYKSTVFDNLFYIKDYVYFANHKDIFEVEIIFINSIYFTKFNFEFYKTLKVFIIVYNRK